VHKPWLSAADWKGTRLTRQTSATSVHKPWLSAADWKLSVVDAEVRAYNAVHKPWLSAADWK